MRRVKVDLTGRTLREPIRELFRACLERMWAAEGQTEQMRSSSEQRSESCAVDELNNSASP